MAVLIEIRPQYGINYLAQEGSRIGLRVYAESKDGIYAAVARMLQENLGFPVSLEDLKFERREYDGQNIWHILRLAQSAHNLKPGMDVPTGEPNGERVKLVLVSYGWDAVCSCNVSHEGEWYYENQCQYCGLAIYR